MQPRIAAYRGGAAPLRGRLALSDAAPRGGTRGHAHPMARRRRPHRADDRLRECREPPARARAQAAPGDRGQARARNQPLPTTAATAHREPRARGPRWSRWTSHGSVGRRSSPSAPHAGGNSCNRCDRFPDAAVRVVRRPHGRDTRWLGAGRSRAAARSRGQPEVRRPRRKLSAIAHAEHVARHAGRALDDAAHRRRPVREKHRSPSHARPGLRRRPRAYRLDQRRTARR